ncbi:hypothetical protein HDU83_007512 [Entophlyctis luteolus]|nr:hypothetical protein HDU83_007512 [Entophlyctis luteolus]
MELQPNDPEFDEKKLDGVRLKFQEQSTSPAVKNGRPVEVSSEIAQLSQTIDAEASRNIEDLLLEIASLKEKFTRASSECDAQNHLISKLQASNITLKKHAMELNIANDEIRSTMKIFLNIADQLKQREPPVHSQEEREMMKFSERAAMIMQCTTVQSFAQPVEFLDRSSTEKRASKDKRKSTVTNRIERPKTPSVNQNFNDQHPNMMTLMQFPLFASFPKGIMELVSLASYEMRRRAGQVIIKKGDEAAEIYFLTSGSVSVSVDEQEVTKLQAPVFFGELGVLFKFKRSATVIATTDSDMVVVTKQKLEEIVSIDPAVKASVEYFSTNKEAWWKNQQYVLSQEKFGGEFANDIARKGLRNMEIFSAAPDAFVDSLAMILKCLVFKPNENIVTIDEESDAMYFVLSGQVEVVGNTGVVHAEILPGSFFGEVGVLLNMKRTASIRAKVETSLFKLTKEDLDKVVVNYPSMKSTLQAAVNERYALIQRRRSSIQTNAENSSSIPDQFDIEVAAQFLAKV